MARLAGAHVAVVGATGAVGREALAMLAERGVAAERVSAFASEASAGSQVTFGAEALEVRPVDVTDAAAADLTLLCVGAEVARELAPAIVEAGGTVVDNSSAFRTREDVPLVVPEQNAHLLTADVRLVANPNCSAILLVVALAPLQRAFGLERIVVSTYQAVSGAGLAAMEELDTQLRAHVDGRELEARVFPEPCALNVFPHESAVDATGFNEEERKIEAETRRILADESLVVVATCARVPVPRVHCESLLVELARPASPGEVRDAVATAPGLVLVDGEESLSARSAAGSDGIRVGRLRAVSRGRAERSRVHCAWLAGDQLRKGAAGNALQIGEILLGLRP